MRCRRTSVVAMVVSCGVAVAVASSGSAGGRSMENLENVVASADFTPLSPVRLADTRPGFTAADGQFSGRGALAAGTSLQLQVTGRGGVAGDAAAVALNVVAVDGGGSGFLTVFECGLSRPASSNLNFTVGSIVSNAVIAKVGAGGNVCIFASQPTQLVVDVNGYFAAGSRFVAVNPTRVLDTRPGFTTSDGQQQGGGPNIAGHVTELQITGRAGVPADAPAVALNLTVTGSDDGAFVTVFPCGDALPNASTVNVTVGATVANLVIAKIGAGGKVCIFSRATADLISDVGGYFPAGTTYSAIRPARLLETRGGLATTDGQNMAIGVRPRGTVTTLQVSGRGGVPNSAVTVVLNVTVTAPTGPGYVTVYPCGIDPPLASNLNFSANATVPNAVIVKLGGGGTVCIFNSQSTYMVVDVNGYFDN